MQKDYIIIKSDGTPAQFMDEEIVIYGDYEEAESDNYPDDMGICEIGYRVENGIQTAYVSKPNSDILLGSFDYDDKIDNFQVRLKEFLNEHPLVNTNEKQFVYRVSAYYDMNISADEEIINEIYATEELAQKRVRHLIDVYKEYSHVIEDCEPYGGEWDEDEFRLYAYMDSEWNVNISYSKEEIRTQI